MIFAMAIGSCGEGEERYLLYVPFFVSPGSSISNIDLDKKFKSCEYEIGLEKLNNCYALTIGSFTSEKEAEQYFPILKSALLWVSIKYTIGFSFPAELSAVTLLDTPQLVPANGMDREIADWDTTEGSYNANNCVIRPDHKRLMRFEGGQATITIGLRSDIFMKCVKEAISFHNPEKIQGDTKLQLAIELYSSYFFEQSPEAKFIKLVTVLEALTPDYPVTESTVLVVNDAKNNIKACRSKYNSNSDEWKELDQLLSRIGQLKLKSIGSSLRTYVSSLINENPSLGDKTDVIIKLKDLYNHRSKLLHEGTTDGNAVQEGLQFLTLFIPKLLELLYKVESA